MTYTGFNFRQSLAGPVGFAGDGPTDVWAGITSASYSPVSSGGTGYGWVGTAALSANGSSAYDPRLGGNSTLNFSPTYRIDLPNGSYDIRLAVGAVSAGTYTGYLRVRVGAGSVLNTDYYDIIQTGMTGAQSLDAMGTLWANTAWPASNVVRRVTVTQGYVLLQSGTPAGGSLTAGLFRHFAYQYNPTPLADGVITDDTKAAGTTPQIFEAQPDQKVLAYCTFAIGDTTDISYTVMQADGITPDPYLTTRIINGQVAICYNSTRHPGTGPTRTIYLVQTDKFPGRHSNSPYTQTLTYTVNAAPTKPFNDGTLASKISTQCYLARKTWVDLLTSPYQNDKSGGLWKGYQGEAFYATATCYNWASILSTVGTMKASAAAGRWFCIELDTDGTSDWATGPGINVNGNPQGDWLFKPELGGGLLIRYKSGGANPILMGSFYLKCPRGVQFEGLTCANDNSTGSAAFGFVRWNSGIDTGNTVLSIIKVNNCKIGYMWGPAYSSLTTTTAPIGKGIVAVYGQGAAEQIIFTNNQSWGSPDTFAFNAKYIHVANNDICFGEQDCMGMGLLGPAFAPYVFGGDTSTYMWWDNNTFRGMRNITDASGIHSDFIQQRYSGITTTATCNYLFENNIVFKSYDNITMEAQMTQMSDFVPVSSIWINNILCCAAPRGIDTGYARPCYIEYNTYGIPGKFTQSNLAYAQQGTYSPSGGAILKSRRNITTGASFVSEDEVVYKGKVSDGIDPNTVMQGPFIVDPSYPSMPRYIHNINDEPRSVTLVNWKKSMAGQLPKAGVNAGAQYILLRASPGDTLSLTKVQAATLRLSTMRTPSATQKKDATIRWGGGTTGYDVNVTVT